MEAPRLSAVELAVKLDQAQKENHELVQANKHLVPFNVHRMLQDAEI